MVEASRGVNQPLSSTGPLSSRPVTRADAATFYRYRGADGRIVIVDSLDRVPAGDRARAERIQLNEAAASSHRAPTLENLGVDWPSFAAGFGAALAVAALLMVFMRGSGRALALFLGAGVTIAGTAAYFGWVRRTTGHSGAAFASPSTIIEDARGAVDKMKQQQAEQDRVIREIQKQAP